ncbi:MAG: ferritin family protein [Deltaproteobacteria bacterium]|nr:ferritin family protein [Deltaproteobacteria bacterium]
MALRAEQGAVRFYQELSARVPGPEAREFFEGMIRIEQQHEREVDEISQELVVPDVVEIPEIRVSPEFIESVPRWALGEQTSDAEAMRVALETELRAARFYQLLSSYLQGAAAETFLQLSRAEQAHAGLISRFIQAMAHTARG